MCDSSVPLSEATGISDDGELLLFPEDASTPWLSLSWIYGALIPLSSSSAAGTPPLFFYHLEMNLYLSVFESIRDINDVRGP